MQSGHGHAPWWLAEGESLGSCDVRPPRKEVVRLRASQIPGRGPVSDELVKPLRGLSSNSRLWFGPPEVPAARYQGVLILSRAALPLRFRR